MLVSQWYQINVHGRRCHRRCVCLQGVQTTQYFIILHLTTGAEEHRFQSNTNRGEQRGGWGTNISLDRQTKVTVVPRRTYLLPYCTRRCKGSYTIDRSTNRTHRCHPEIQGRRSIWEVPVFARCVLWSGTGARSDRIPIWHRNNQWRGQSFARNVRNHRKWSPNTNNRPYHRCWPRRARLDLPVDQGHIRVISVRGESPHPNGQSFMLRSHIGANELTVKRLELEASQT